MKTSVGKAASTVGMTRERGRCGRPGERTEEEDGHDGEGARDGQLRARTVAEVAAVEDDGGRDGGRPGQDGDERGGQNATEEVAPPWQRGSPPALESTFLPGGDRAHAVGAPGGDGESEYGVASDVGRGVLAFGAASKMTGRPTPTAITKWNPQPLGLRWPVERTNAWLSTYGQLRRNTDRFIAHRLSQIALAVVFTLTIKLFAYAERWNH
jgi:hypothetical protein